MAEYFCVCCRTPFLNPYPLNQEGQCGLCSRGLSGFDAAYAFGSHEGVLRNLVHEFKYGRIRTLAGPLGEMMISVLPREQRFDIIVPMPLHWLRRWQRGFNQARLLARVVSLRTGVPIVNAVRRSRSTASQAGLSNAKRRRNVAAAFTMGKRIRLKNLRVLLVDDVFTTGATANACATVLKRAGAAHVSVLALARTDRRHITETVAAGPRIQSAAVGALS